MVRGNKRLLILDGHASHCTLNLILYARRHDIIILCLPPHTTHRLQPCDVGVFGPLATAWGHIVKEAYSHGAKVSKRNFLSYYVQARERALTPSNITSAFMRCGIWPYDPSVITEKDLAPSDNTSNLAAQPIAPSLPPYLEHVPEPNPASESNAPSQPSNTPGMQSTQETYSRSFKIKPKNDLVHPKETATKKELNAYINKVEAHLHEAYVEISRQYASQVLAQLENQHIRQRLYGKSNGRAKTTHAPTGTRILTSNEQIDALAEYDQRKKMAALMKEGGQILRFRRKLLDDREKEAQNTINDVAKKEIKNAEDAKKKLEKEVTALEKKLQRSTDLLNAASKRAKSARGPAAKIKAEQQKSTYSDQIMDYNAQLNVRRPEFEEAKSHFEGLVTHHTARVEAINTIERRYKDAVDEEKRVLKEKAAEEKLKADADAARRANLQKRIKDPVSHWRALSEKQLSQKLLTKEDQQDVYLDPCAVRLPINLAPSEVESGNVEPSLEEIEVIEAISYDPTFPVDPIIVADGPSSARVLRSRRGEVQVSPWSHLDASAL
jgi:hypothetical protein